MPPAPASPGSGDPSQPGRCPGHSQGQVCVEFTGHLLPTVPRSRLPSLGVGKRGSPAPAQHHAGDPRAMKPDFHETRSPEHSGLYAPAPPELPRCTEGLARGSRLPSPSACTQRPLPRTVSPSLTLTSTLDWPAAPATARETTLAGDPGPGTGPHPPGVSWGNSGGRAHMGRAPGTLGRGGPGRSWRGQGPPPGSPPQEWDRGSPALASPFSRVGARPPPNLYFLKSFFFSFLLKKIQL